MCPRGSALALCSALGLGVLGGCALEVPLFARQERPAGLRGASMVALGWAHTCAQTSDGAYCWGANDHGQLGAGDTASSSLPRPVSGQLRFTSMDAGESFTCGVEAGRGDVYCWGANDLGQLGDGSTVDSVVPVRVALPPEVVARSVHAQAQHACALTEGDDIYCWGENRFNVAGAYHDVWTRSDPLPTPNRVEGPWVAVSPGEHHTCGIRADGTLHCWGMGLWGQLGNGVREDLYVVTRVTEFTDWSHIASGQHHTCGLREGGRLYCWGMHPADESELSFVPAPFGPVDPFVALDAHWFSTCAERADGTGACVGRNVEGQIDPRRDQSVFYDPWEMPTHDLHRVRVGLFHMCGIQRADGAVLCWGDDRSGQLGGGAPDERGIVRVAAPGQ